MTTPQYLKLGQLTFLLSFGLGSIIFVSYLITGWDSLLVMGYAYVALTGLFNLAVVFLLLQRAQQDKANSKALYKRTGLLFVNLPILLVYTWIVLYLLGTMRITLVNHTAFPLNDLQLVGCGGAALEELAPQQHKTLWVDITGDCSIELVYSSQGEQKRATVVGYATSGMGGKMTYVVE